MLINWMPMSALILLGLVAPVAYIEPASAVKPNLDTLFEQAASDAHVPLPLLRAVCWVESEHKARLPFKLDGITQSHGPCQIKLVAARDVGYKGSARALDQPEVSIPLAAKFLRVKWVKFSSDWRKTVTAYNRGRCTPGMSTCNPYVMRVLFALREGR